LNNKIKQKNNIATILKCYMLFCSAFRSITLIRQLFCWSFPFVYFCIYISVFLKKELILLRDKIGRVDVGIYYFICEKYRMLHERRKKIQ
jgi:hypothetical protein